MNRTIIFTVSVVLILSSCSENKTKADINTNEYQEIEVIEREIILESNHLKISYLFG